MTQATLQRAQPSVLLHVEASRALLMQGLTSQQHPFHPTHHSLQTDKSNSEECFPLMVAAASLGFTNLHTSRCDLQYTETGSSSTCVVETASLTLWKSHSLLTFYSSLARPKSAIREEREEEKKNGTNKHAGVWLILWLTRKQWGGSECKVSKGRKVGVQGGMKWEKEEYWLSYTTGF